MSVNDSPQEVPEDLVTVREAARTSGVSAATLYYWMQQGRVAVYPGRRGRLVSLAAVQALVAPPDPDAPADAVAIHDAMRLAEVSRRDIVAWVKQGRLLWWQGRHGRLVRVADVRTIALHSAAGGDTPPPADALLIREASRRTGVTRDRLYTWTKQGLLPAWRGAGGGLLVRLADVTVLAERHGRGLPLQPGR